MYGVIYDIKDDRLRQLVGPLNKSNASLMGLDMDIFESKGPLRSGTLVATKEHNVPIHIFSWIDDTLPEEDLPKALAPVTLM